jgi:hypothetical protein
MGGRKEKVKGQARSTTEEERQRTMVHCSGVRPIHLSVVGGDEVIA